MLKYLAIALLALNTTSLLDAQSVGNPRPGFPHDTIMIHVTKTQSSPKGCVTGGGHALFLRHLDGKVQPAILNITMIDWDQDDNDNDGVFDEDPPDGIDNDGNNGIDEDGPEPGKETKALDCDSLNDGEVSLQIRDADPRAGYVSTQEWFMRLVGKPGQNFAFSTFANQVVSCTLVLDPDGTPNSGDETVSCTSGEWVKTAQFNLGSLGCVKQVKTNGGGGVKAGGKTPFCDITDGFEVDIDNTGDGTIDLFDQFVFSVSCLDDPLTINVNEELYCPLSSLIWDIDETNTTSQAKAQIFVGHTGNARIQPGKIK